MSDYTYRGFGINDICPPIPVRDYDFEFHPEHFDDEPDDDGHYAYPELHGYAETLEKCKKRIDEILADLENCPACYGRGWIAWSCCGDDISNNDYDNCPTCYEHCTTDEGDVCDDCHGLGRIVNEENKQHERVKI